MLVVLQCLDPIRVRVERRAAAQPLRQVLDVVGESGAVEWKEYDGWGMLLPQGDFYFRTGDAASWLGLGLGLG